MSVTGYNLNRRANWKDKMCIWKLRHLEYLESMHNITGLSRGWMGLKP